MKNVKIVIGANYGDEGKGLMTRHFALDGLHNDQKGVVVLHNGSAQHGHTVDYNPHFRHVYHHFGCGTGDGLPTYFAETFWVHPMEFAREYVELSKAGITPQTYCHPLARVVTPFDMLVDHATEAWIGLQYGEREYGSCGYGTWCAIESRGYDNVYSIGTFQATKKEHMRLLLDETWNQCVVVLLERGVDVEKLPQYRDYFIPGSEKKERLIKNFLIDLQFFLDHTTISSFGYVFNQFDNIIFENGQGLGLDMDVDNDWHTTSKTGLVNPYNMLNDKEDFTAEVCYVSRSYLTRHGVGPMEERAKKVEINADMEDKTNLHNEFQGSLTFGYLTDTDQKKRIETDWALVSADKRFVKSMALTHCNEFEDTYKQSNYMSYNPYNVIKM